MLIIYTLKRSNSVAFIMYSLKIMSKHNFICSENFALFILLVIFHLTQIVIVNKEYHCSTFFRASQTNSARIVEIQAYYKSQTWCELFDIFQMQPLWWATVSLTKLYNQGHQFHSNVVPEVVLLHKLLGLCTDSHYPRQTGRVTNT